MHAIRRTLLTVVAALLSVATLSVAVEAAQAAIPAPAWSINSTSSPTHFTAGDSSGRAVYAITVENTGAADSDGSPVTVTDTLPVGVTVKADPPADQVDFQISDDGGSATPPCDPGPPATCTITVVLHPGGRLVMFVPVKIDAGAPPILTNQVSVSGGGAPGASVTTHTPVTAAPAAPGFQSVDTALTDAAGGPVSQAGSHPYQFHLGFQLNTNNNTAPGGRPLNAPAGSLKDITTTLPVGMVVNPAATPVLCTEAQLESDTCPVASAIGIAHARTGNFGFVDPVFSDAIYNMVPPPGTPASFAFNAADLDIYVHLIGGVDAAGNYALTAEAKDLPQVGQVSGIDIDLWGDPSDPSHDHRRSHCASGYSAFNGISCPVAATQTPLLTMPSACSGPLSISLSHDSWEAPGTFLSASAFTQDVAGDPVPVTGCSRLGFDPSISVQPDTTFADSPTGLDVDLKVPQTDGLIGTATSNLKDASVTLPEGVSVSPSAADGLKSCSSAQIAIKSKNDPTCPDGSKIGTVSVDTPLLSDPLEGSVFLAAQNDNPSHSVLGIYVVVQGDGVTLKLVGQVHADPTTGRLTASFKDQPQLPFTDFKLHFNGGSRASLASPEECGSYSSSSVLSPWSGTAPVSSTDVFSITSGCAGGFSPAFTAGVANLSAGESSVFTLQVARADGQEHIKSITTTLAPGILANVGSVPLCAEVDAVAGTCNGASQVGTTDTAAGPGTNPFHIAGKVFLTGPYKGGPYGLSIVVPAIAGPFDLGTVVVRAAISVDPIDGHVTVVSDDVPDILDVKGDDGATEGFPLRVRSIAVNMDRPAFMLNPTSCDPMSITGTLRSWKGSTAAVSSRFQVGNCAALDVAPKLAINLTGKGQTTDDKHPGVDATLTQKPGQANLKKVVVTLPLSLALDPDNAGALCEFTDGSKVDPTCPKTSIVGTATATTPILNGPLAGPVYFVKNIRIDAKSGRQIRTLPKLVIPLTGPNGLRLNLTGTSNVVDDHLVTTFDQIPDAPVSSFKLNIVGGKHGILVVSGTDICKATQVAAQQIDGQNGKTADADIYLQTPACALKIVSKKVGKTSVAVKVGGLGAGKVTVTGRGIKKTTKTIAKSTVATITAKRTKGKPGKVTVSFDPTGPAKARKTSK